MDKEFIDEKISENYKISEKELYKLKDSKIIKSILPEQCNFDSNYVSLFFIFIYEQRLFRRLFWNSKKNSFFGRFLNKSINCFFLT